MRNNDLEFEYQKREDGFIYVNEDRLEEEIMHFLETGQDVEKLRIPEDISRDAYLSLTSKRENVIHLRKMPVFWKSVQDMEKLQGICAVREKKCLHTS